MSLSQESKNIMARDPDVTVSLTFLPAGCSSGGEGMACHSGCSPQPLPGPVHLALSRQSPLAHQSLRTHLGAELPNRPADLQTKLQTAPCIVLPGRACGVKHALCPVHF